MGDVSPDLRKCLANTLRLDLHHITLLHPCIYLKEIISDKSKVD